MKVLDPGHKYELASLDGGEPIILTHTKRIGEKYPGNEGDPYPGTTLQETWRAQIERLRYLDHQEHNEANSACIANLKENLWLLEARAAKRHGRQCPSMDQILNGPFCPKCLHAGCEGACH